MAFSRTAVALVVVLAGAQFAALFGGEAAVAPPVKTPLTGDEEKEVDAIKEELEALQSQLAIAKTRTNVSKVDAVVSQKKDDRSVKTAGPGKLVIGGLVQVWFTQYQRDNKGLFQDSAVGILDTNEAGHNSSFLVKRAQLNFTYKPSGYVTSYLMLDAAREAGTYPLVTDNQAIGNSIFKQNNYVAPEIDNNNGAAAGFGNFLPLQNLHNGLGSPARILQDAFINFHNNRECPGDFDWHHDFQVGQFLPPFGEEGLRSASQLDFVERSFVGIMGNSRDMGAQLHGTWWCDRFQYWVGAFNGAQDYHKSNGSSNNRADTNSSKDIAYRVLIRPLDSECLGLLEFGFSSEIGRHGNSSTNDPILAPENNLDRTSTWAMRHDAWGYFAPGGALRGFWTRGEWGWYKDRNAPGTVIDFTGNGGTDFGNQGSGSGLAQSNGKSFAVQGWYVAGGYRFEQAQLCVPKFLKPVELAFRYQSFQNVLTADLVDPSHTNAFSTRVYTGGINYYIKDSLAKIQFNYNKVVNPTENSASGLRTFHKVRNDSMVVNFQVAF